LNTVPIDSLPQPETREADSDVTSLTNDEYEELKTKLDAKCKEHEYQLPVFQKEQSKYFGTAHEGNTLSTLMTFINTTQGAGY
jgi:hypothetical protein